MLVNDEGGLQALSEGFKSEDMERLQRVLPENISTAKANGVLHKLNFRLNTNNNSLAKSPRSKDSSRTY